MDNMDRRAFLAFVLSMLLFVVFYWYYSPMMEAKQKRAQRGGRTDTLSTSSGAQVPARPESGAEKAPAAALKRQPAAEREVPVAGAFPEAEAEAPEIVVESPLYRVRLSAAGGRITSVELKQYETDGEPVELIAQFPDSVARSEGLASLAVVGSGGTVDLDRVLFTPYRQGYGEPLGEGSVVLLDERRPVAEIVFRAEGEGGAIERTFKFDADRYVIEAEVTFDAGVFGEARGIAWSFGPGLQSTERNKKFDYMNFQASLLLGEDISHYKLRKFSKRHAYVRTGTLGWLTLQSKYFTAAFIPSEPVVDAKAELVGSNSEHLLSARIEIPAMARGGKVRQRASFYVGPLDYKRVKALGVGLEKNINMGYKFLRPLSWVMLWSLITLYKVIPNYGLVIIILSIFTKVLFYRLTHKSHQSMKQMQSLQPKLQALKEKYKDDKQKLSAETMKLYKQHGVNPLGGCLPMLLQAPVFIALYSVLRYTIELRGAHFVAWINDLSQQDVLAVLPFAIPFIGHEVSLLPILMGIAMLVQTKVGGSLTGGAPGASQSKAMTYVFPIVLTYFFYRMPSGLVLYWLVNNILTIGQQYYINKQPAEAK
jgi:YidC/Oxa1 family membrane protein insertase